MELRLDATTEELPVFLAETDEILQGLDEQLIRLEQDGPSTELLQEVFRAAHTIKGSSAAIGHTRMAKLTHAMETLLDRLRRGERTTSPEMIEHLFVGLDLLKVLAAEVETLEQSDVDVGELVHALEALAAAGADPSARPSVEREQLRPATMDAPIGATHHVLLKLEVEDWAAVRALQALIAFESLGELVESRPSRAEVERQEVKGRLEAWIRSDRSADVIRAELAAVPEVSILSLVDAEQAADARASEDGDEEAEDGDEHATESDAGPPTPIAQGTAPRRAAGRPANATVRIDVERLDKLLNLVGELVIDRTRLLGLGRALQEQIGDHHLLSEVTETTLHLGRVTDELQSEVMMSRMLAIGTVFSRFPRVVRDLQACMQKKIDLVIQGQETELDRSVIEEIGDPIVHLLRNAIDHGVEPPADRLATGKPETATVRLAAEHVEGSIVITVQDDGRGIDGERMRARAVEKGVITAEAAARLSDGEAVDLVFAPGFSTTAEVSDLSGRGVGMDIVRTNVERLGGTVEVQTEIGRGARFILRLPLTLAIVHALLVRVGESTYALPLTSVTETLRVPVCEIQQMQRQEAIVLRGRVLPIVRLTRVFKCGESADNTKDVLVVVVKVGDRQIGLAVDRLLGEQEVVIKSLGSLIGDVQGISSAAILGDGTVALIVDVPALVQRLATDRYEWRNPDVRDAGQPPLSHTA